MGQGNSTGTDAAANDGSILYLPIETIVNFGCPPNSTGGRPEKKLLVGDTFRPYYQIIYKWTANCWQSCKQELSDKTRTNERTDERTENVQIFVSLRLWTSLCETMIRKNFSSHTFMERVKNTHMHHLLSYLGNLMIHSFLDRYRKPRSSNVGVIG